MCYLASEAFNELILINTNTNDWPDIGGPIVSRKDKDIIN